MRKCTVRGWQLVAVLSLVAVALGGPGLTGAAAGEAKEEPHRVARVVQDHEDHHAHNQEDDDALQDALQE
jgi:hypothetical protein